MRGSDESHYGGNIGRSLFSSHNEPCWSANCRVVIPPYSEKLPLAAMSSSPRGDPGHRRSFLSLLAFNQEVRHGNKSADPDRNSTAHAGLSSGTGNPFYN